MKKFSFDNAKYMNICNAILKTADERKIDFRDIAREWIKLFEETRVVGWNRDDFLECLLKCKEVRKNDIK